MGKDLILFTISYPYLKAAENTFLKHELVYLLDNFENIFIIPQTVGGKKDIINKQIVIDESLADTLGKRKLYVNKVVNSLNAKLVFGEILAKPSLILHPKKLLKLLLYVNKIMQTSKWFKASKYNKRDNILVYTYWFTHVTSFFTLCNNHYNIISRVHGIDLFEERQKGYIPLREQSIDKIKAIFCVSSAGINYLSKEYPKSVEKYKLARLGTRSESKKPIIRVSAKEEKNFRIVSCSAIIPLKRVELILQGIELFAEKYFNQNIEWMHFGDGPLFDHLKLLTNQIRKNNLNIQFKGYTINEQILNYYKTNYVDVFITASSSEGGVPVSLQEAQMNGIPCVGTNIGGIPEIIDKHTGILLPANPNPTEISDALESIFSLNKKQVLTMRESCYNTWKENFNADVNFKKFAEEISAL